MVLRFYDQMVQGVLGTEGNWTRSYMMMLLSGGGILGTRFPMLVVLLVVALTRTASSQEVE